MEILSTVFLNRDKNIPKNVIYGDKRQIFFTVTMKKTLSCVDNFVDNPMVYCKSDIHTPNKPQQTYIYIYIIYDDLYLDKTK